MKHALAIILLLLTPMAFGQDAAVKVPAFGVQESAADDLIDIGITGPDKAKSGDSVTLRLTGTPSLDLSKALTDQLDWLMGEDRMFAYLLMPGQPQVPLDVEGTIVFGVGGATMRPQVTFPVADPGEYRLIIDWNSGQNQLVCHTVVVEGGEVNPQPGPGPQPGPTPDLSLLHVQILLEQDDLMQGMEGMQLNNKIEELKSYLNSLPCQWSMMDDDQPAASSSITLLKQMSLPPTNVLAVFALSPEQPSRLIGAVGLDDSVANIEVKLAKLGVKK